MNTKYDAILVVENAINEGIGDDRMYSKKYDPSQKGMKNFPDWEDPKMHAQFTFGSSLRNDLESLGRGYSVKVTDFKKWVVVDIEHHNHVSGKTAGKTFLIVFKEKGDGIVLSNHNRYRTISGPGQASSYIRSAIGSLTTATQ